MNTPDNPATKEPLAGNYFVSAYPPFSCWQETAVPKLERILNTPASSGSPVPLGLYVHLPFCVERCMYCYYLSYARQSTHSRIDRYLEALNTELSLYREKPYFANRQLQFVYFGGGTPSVLSEEQIDRLLSGLQRLFPWSEVREATFECAPKTVSEAKLRTLKEAGITRLSLGIQQLNDDVLRKNGRIHFVKDVERAYDLIRSAAFDTVNVDLIVGLLGETDRSFMESLERVIGMQPDSITLYQLEIPYNTPLFRKVRDGTLDDTLASWETKRARLACGFAQLEASGYQLRSAYTAVRDAEQQEFVYQDAQYHAADLLGIGASAFSYLNGVHHQNLASLTSYLERLEAHQLPLNRAYNLTKEERLIREFVLQLKLGKVNGSAFQEKFGIGIFEHFYPVIEGYIEQGLLERNGHELRVTRDGLLRVDRMLEAFYRPEHQGARYS